MTTVHSTLSLKQRALLCNTSKCRQQVKCIRCKLKKAIQKKKSRRNVGKKIKKPQEKVLGIQTKTAKTGSGNRVAIENGNSTGAIRDHLDWKSLQSNCHNFCHFIIFLFSLNQYHLLFLLSLVMVKIYASQQNCNR